MKPLLWGVRVTIWSALGKEGGFKVINYSGRIGLSLVKGERWLPLVNICLLLAVTVTPWVRVIGGTISRAPFGAQCQVSLSKPGECFLGSLKITMKWRVLKLAFYLSFKSVLTVVQLLAFYHRLYLKMKITIENAKVEFSNTEESLYICPANAHLPRPGHLQSCSCACVLCTSRFG